MKKESPVRLLVEELKKDKDYYIAWESNIAMAFYDNYLWYARKWKKRVMNKKDIHCIANNSAICFLDLLMKEKRRRI